MIGIMVSRLRMKRARISSMDCDDVQVVGEGAEMTPLPTTCACAHTSCVPADPLQPETLLIRDVHNFTTS